MCLCAFVCACLRRFASTFQMLPGMLFLFARCLTILIPQRVAYVFVCICVCMLAQVCFYVPDAAWNTGAVCGMPHNTDASEASLSTPLAGNGAYVHLLGWPEPYIYGVYTVFLAGVLSNIRLYTAYIYGSGQPYTFTI
jgi:hypothetical protein